MEAYISRFHATLKEKGMRLTPQRRVMLEVLKGTTSHPTADWVYKSMREIIPNISLGTVYRNLNVLKEQGLVLELNFEGCHRRYDGNTHEHSHIICLDCGRVDDLDIGAMEAIQKLATKGSGYMIKGYRMDFSGVCPQCMGP